MRPFSSCLLPAAFVAAVFMVDVSGASAAGMRGPVAGGTVGSAATNRRTLSRAGIRGRFGGRGRFAHCGFGRCGAPIYGGYGLDYGYGYGYGGYGYGFDPRLLRGDLPSERDSVVPAVAGIPAPPVAPPAIYVIGDERQAARGRASRRTAASEPRVVRAR